MVDKRRVYFDSCCFIDVVKQDVGMPLDTERAADVWHLKQLLQANRDGEITVFTSALTIAECTHAGGQASEKVKDRFGDLLTGGQYLVLVQPTPFIMIDARDLRWVHSMNLKGADAVHLATALDRKCEEFITTDGQVKKLQSKHQFLAMGLRIISGRETSCLPEKYRQGAMEV